jgi:hypothetical protein
VIFQLVIIYALVVLALAAAFAFILAHCTSSCFVLVPSLYIFRVCTLYEFGLVLFSY